MIEGAASTFPSPTVPPELANYFGSQAAKAARLDNFQDLITKYQDDPDTTDDESVASLPRNGLQSPPPSPKFNAPPIQVMKSPSDNITTNEKIITATPPSAGSISARKPYSSPKPKRYPRSRQPWIVTRKITRSQARSNTEFLVLGVRGQATTIDSVLSSLSRSAGVQRRRQTNGNKAIYND